MVTHAIYIISDACDARDAIRCAGRHRHLAYRRKTTPLVTDDFF